MFNKISKMLYEKTPLLDTECDITASYLMVLLKPELEKAEKWDRVKEIARVYEKSIPCTECIWESHCKLTHQSLCYCAFQSVDALEGEKE
jgi:MinD superfamily P-loop ATPase